MWDVYPDHSPGVLLSNNTAQSHVSVHLQETAPEEEVPVGGNPSLLRRG